MQLDRYFMSQSSEFCCRNPLCCFSTSVCFVIDSVWKFLDTPSNIVSYEILEKSIHFLMPDLAKCLTCLGDLSMSTISDTTSRWYSVSRQVVAGMSLVTPSVTLTIVSLSFCLCYTLFLTIDSVIYKCPEEEIQRSQMWRKRGQGMGPFLPIQGSGNSLSGKAQKRRET